MLFGLSCNLCYNIVKSFITNTLPKTSGVNGDININKHKDKDKDIDITTNDNDNDNASTNSIDYDQSIFETESYHHLRYRAIEYFLNYLKYSYLIIVIHIENKNQLLIY